MKRIEQNVVLRNRKTGNIVNESVFHIDVDAVVVNVKAIPLISIRSGRYGVEIIYDLYLNEKRIKTNQSIVKRFTERKEADFVYDNFNKLIGKSIFQEEDTHFVIHDDYGYSEYDDNPKIAERYFDLPDDIPSYVETIEFRGHKYHLRSYKRLAAIFENNSKFMDRLPIEGVNNFIGMVILGSEIINKGDN